MAATARQRDDVIDRQWANQGAVGTPAAEPIDEAFPVAGQDDAALFPTTTLQAVPGASDRIAAFPVADQVFVVFAVRSTPPPVDLVLRGAVGVPPLPIHGLGAAPVSDSPCLDLRAVPLFVGFAPQLVDRVVMQAAAFLLTAGATSLERDTPNGLDDH